MSMREHALVVGGSGMLAAASLWLAQNGYTVSVIGRNKEKLNRLQNKHNQIHPIAVDYYDTSDLQAKLRQSIADNGAYKLVVAWIHWHDKEILKAIADEIKDNPWELFHVLGSSSQLDEIIRDAEDFPNCTYHQVQLGFIVEGHRSRWLTHEEISNGVIESIRTKAKRHVVGTLTPWDQRP